MNPKSLIFAVAVAGLGTVAPIAISPAAADHPNQPQGFGFGRTYHQAPDLPDQVDLFSGRLSVALRIGDFPLIYNNNVWSYDTVDGPSGPLIEALPNRMLNTGLGWHLGFGELYPPGHWYNNLAPNQYLLVDRDGSHRVFYFALHRAEDDGDPDVYYTRDGSYLRLTRRILQSTTGSSSEVWDVESPDGSGRRFLPGGPQGAFRLGSAWDAHGTSSYPLMTVEYSPDDRLRTIRDRFGREHFIHLAVGGDPVDGLSLNWMLRLITQVDLQGVGGQRLVYDFTYRNLPIDASCKNESTTYGSQRRVPLLVRIDRPDGTAYEMEGGGEPSYLTTCGGAGEIDDGPGSLTRLKLPTGGVLSWSYQEYEFPPGDNWGVFNTSAGVATREALDASGTVVGAWSYRSRGLGAPHVDAPEMATDVVTLPEGHCTRHFHNAVYWVSPASGLGWQYGLPFVTRESSGGKFLSRQTFTDHDPTTLLCDDGTKERSTYVRYRHDPIPGAGPVPGDPTCVQSAQNGTPCSRLDEWTHLNRTLDGLRTVFHDDLNLWIDREHGEFDGLGNFRKTVTRGSLWFDSTNEERRETYVNYTKSPGIYPNGGYSPPDPAGPWVLRTFDSVQTTELDAQGEQTARREFVFDSTTGALRCSRSLRTGTSRSTRDVIQTFAYDARGHLTDAKLYGGDWWTLPDTTGPDCGPLPARPVYWTRHEYDFDVRARTRSISPNGTPSGFLRYDVDVDPLSGAILATRDPSGFTTSIAYDTADRLIRFTPEEGAETRITYVDASGTSPAEIRRRVVDGPTTFSEAEQILDPFGRVRDQRRRLPGEAWAERRVERNILGWPLYVTEWDRPDLRTQYLDYDPFGRPGRIVPPEGPEHEVLFDYLGQRQVKRSATVQTAVGADEVYAHRVVRFDSYGRLRTVLEEAGPVAAATTTDFLYDVGSRLTRIQGGHGTAQQVRAFGYDNHGFLRFEQHPEKGITGNGTVYYGGYDPAGNPKAIIDGPNDLGFNYDFHGRLTKIYDRAQNNRKLRIFLYDGGVGRGQGKLWKSIGHNYMPLPWNGPAEVDVAVTQQYNYEAVGGLVNQRDLFVGWPDRLDRFRARFTYDAAGNTTEIDYPRCTTLPCSSFAAGTSPNVSFEYDLGWLTSIPGWANHVDYHASGLWSRIEHSNGVTDSLTLDAFRRERVGRIRTLGASSDWDTGLYAYDGNGNIKAMGADRFAYDRADRLIAAHLHQELGLELGYAYDPFGNLLFRNASIPGYDVTYPVDSATNRLTGTVYDGAGNVTGWGGLSFQYDRFNRVARQGSEKYIYDASGERVAIVEDVPGVRNVRFSVRGLDNQLLSSLTYDGAGYGRLKDTIYAGGRLLAARVGGVDRHYHVDHLGTPRRITDGSGQVVSSPKILPYGQEIQPDGFDDRKLTGHERDTAGTDYLHARHYFSGMGRFLSVDPVRGVPSSPQTLNRYAYVAGNPIRYQDPDGRFLSPFMVDLLFGFYYGDEIVVIGVDPEPEPPARPLQPGVPDRGGLPISPEESDDDDGLGSAGGRVSPPADSPRPSPTPVPRMPSGTSKAEKILKERGLWDDYKNRINGACNPLIEDCDGPDSCLSESVVGRPIGNRSDCAGVSACDSFSQTCGFLEEAEAQPKLKLKGGVGPLSLDLQINLCKLSEAICGRI